MQSFADIPGEIRRLVAAGDRVAIVLLDGLGLEMLLRERAHPLFDRLEITPLQSQFPSTTTAHVPTMHLGQPVTEHGLYEWAVLEPSLGTLICPLKFKRAISAIDDELAGRLDPSVLIPSPTFYELLGVPSVVLQPRSIVDSAFTRTAASGGDRIGFDQLAEGLRGLAHAFRKPESECRYAYLYWPAIDATGHHSGPRSPEYRAAARHALDCIEDALPRLAGVTVLLTADHGQVDVHPDRVDYLDELWPELPKFLTHQWPAGSARDVFLHVREQDRSAVLTGLAERLGDHALVCPATDLFPGAGPRLTERLGDVAVLPTRGRMAWLRPAAGVETWNLGSHGGREHDETATYLARVSTD